MTRSKPAPPGRPYDAPKVFRIRIAGDELAVAGCKTAVSSGPRPSSCLKSMCKNAGS